MENYLAGHCQALGRRSLIRSSFCSPKKVFTHIKKLLVMPQPFHKAAASKTDPPLAHELTQPRPVRWEMPGEHRHRHARSPPPTTPRWYGARGETLTRVMFWTRKRRDTMSSSAAPETYSTSIGPYCWSPGSGQYCKQGCGEKRQSSL